MSTNVDQIFREYLPENPTPEQIRMGFSVMTELKELEQAELQEKIKAAIKRGDLEKVRELVSLTIEPLAKYNPELLQTAVGHSQLNIFEYLLHTYKHRITSFDTQVAASSPYFPEALTQHNRSAKSDNAIFQLPLAYLLIQQGAIKLAIELNAIDTNIRGNLFKLLSILGKDNPTKAQELGCQFIAAQLNTRQNTRWLNCTYEHFITKPAKVGILPTAAAYLAPHYKEIKDQFILWAEANTYNDKHTKRRDERLDQFLTTLAAAFIQHRAKNCTAKTPISHE